MICALAVYGLTNAQGIINIEDKRSRSTDSISWYETIDLGAYLSKNRQQVLSLTGRVQVEFAYKNKLLMSITSANFVKAGNEEFTNEGYQHIRYNHTFLRSEWLTFEIFGQIQYNELTRIKLRALAGTGFRVRILEQEKQRAHLGLTYMYEYDEESQTEIIHQDGRLSSYLSFRIKPVGLFTIQSTTYYQPLLNDFNDFRLSSSTTADFALSDKFSLRTTYTIAFDSRVPAGAPNTVYSLGNSLAYRF